MTTEEQTTSKVLLYGYKWSSSILCYLMVFGTWWRLYITKSDPHALWKRVPDGPPLPELQEEDRWDRLKFCIKTGRALEKEIAELNTRSD